MEVKFNLKRRLGRFLLQTYIPTILIVLVSWLSFWMQPENVTERIMLGVTSLLTIFAQHAISLQSLPPVSYLKVLTGTTGTKYVKLHVCLTFQAIDVFMNLCTLFVFLSIVEFVIISKILSRYDHPDWTSISPSDHSEDEVRDNEKPPRVGILAMPKTKEDGWRLATKIDRISRVVIPTLFLILNAIYWGIFEEIA